MARAYESPAVQAGRSGGSGQTMSTQNYTVVERILSRLENVREKPSGGWMALCPAHDDRQNSLSVDVKSDGRVLLKCFAGCEFKAIVRAIGLKERDLSPRHSASVRLIGRPALTLGALANDKALPETFLRELGLAEEGDAVRVPYWLADGALAPRQRIRTALKARDGTRWTKGVGKLVPYGLWRLTEARKAGFVVLVEGESDSWTLWYHGFPCLGVPGASMAGKLEPDHLKDIAKVYVLREPDGGGKTFINGVARRLAEVGFSGQAFMVKLDGAKDPNELHKRNPDGFREAFQRALAQAQPLTLERDEGHSAGPYIADNGAICHNKSTNQGVVTIPLCNFKARIVREETRDDGAERTTVFTIEGTLSDGQALPAVNVSAEKYPAMNWVTTAWGTRAVVYAGQGTKDHLRVGIQLLSGEVPRRTVYAHLGWRRIGGAWHYLHAGGAIGAGGVEADISVEPGDGRLSEYALPAPPTGEKLRQAIRSSLSLLETGPATVTLPLLMTIYRAPLSEAVPADFTLFLAGPTGSQKSELTALAQAHYGAGFSGKNLPGNWAATANALEKMAFLAKDAVLTIDDFAPTGTLSDVQRLHADADRILRGQGNRSGRPRMRPDGSLRPEYYPRGLILSSGEDIPRGQSLRSRLFIVEVNRGEVVLDKLTSLQGAAARGVLAESMSGYLRWLVPQLDSLKVTLPARQHELRTQARASIAFAHDRTPDIVASLTLGWETFLRFALEVGAITEQQASDLRQDGWQALGEVAKSQAEHQESEEPTGRFLALLMAAVSSGTAHVADARTGQEPPQDPARWGWSKPADGFGIHWQARGARVGWLDGEDLLLEPDSAFATVQKLARDQGTSLPITQRTLWKRMAQKGLLASREDSQSRNTIRRDIVGERKRVVHISMSPLSGKNGPNGPNGPKVSRQALQAGFQTSLVDRFSGDPPETVQKNGPGENSWTDSVDRFSGAVAKTVQKNSPETGSGSGSGPIGPNGPFLEDRRPLRFVEEVATVDDAGEVF